MLIAIILFVFACMFIMTFVQDPKIMNAPYNGDDMLVEFPDIFTE